MARNRRAMSILPGFDSNHESLQLDFLNLMTDYSPIISRETAHISPVKKVKNPTILGFQYFGIVDSKKKFENFIESSSNIMALNAIRNFISDDQHTNLNVLYLHGQTGIGKSHLLHAASNILMIQRKPFYFNSAFNICTDHEITKIFKSYSYILIEDVQDIDTNLEAQKIICQLIDSAHSRQFKLIITGSKTIGELTKLTERLMIKLSASVCVGLKPMDSSLVERYIDKKCAELEINPTTLEFQKIANSKFLNGYSIDGALLHLKNRLELSIDDSNLEEETNQTNLFDYENEVIQGVIEKVSHEYNIKTEYLMSKRRDKEFTVPRHLAMYLLKEKMGLTLSQVGKIFSKDHTTVLYAVEKIRKKVKNDRSFNSFVASF